MAAIDALLASKSHSVSIKDEEMSSRFQPAKNMSDKAHNGLHCFEIYNGLPEADGWFAYASTNGDCTGY